MPHGGNKLGHRKGLTLRDKITKAIKDKKTRGSGKVKTPTSPASKAQRERELKKAVAQQARDAKKVEQNEAKKASGRALRSKRMSKTDGF